MNNQRIHYSPYSPEDLKKATGWLPLLQDRDYSSYSGPNSLRSDDNDHDHDVQLENYRARPHPGRRFDDFTLPTPGSPIAVLPTFCFPRKVWRVVIRAPRNSLYTSKRAFDMFSGKCHILNRGPNSLGTSRVSARADVTVTFDLDSVFMLEYCVTDSNFT